MSHLFGEIRQIAYVVHNIGAAMRTWSESLGVGPWFYRERVSPDVFRYRRTNSPLVMSIALANSGDMQYELIQQHGDAPSLYRDFLSSHGEGQQHVGYFVDDLAAPVARALELGYEMGHEGEVANAGPFVYMTRPGAPPGTVIEFLAMTEPRRRTFAAIREMARGWDGSNPVRTSLS
jgi:hypothetical protein